METDKILDVAFKNPDLKHEHGPLVMQIIEAEILTPCPTMNNTQYEQQVLRQMFGAKFRKEYPIYPVE